MKQLVDFRFIPFLLFSKDGPVNDSNENSVMGFLMRGAVIFVFVVTYSSAGSMGAFKFDNNFIYGISESLPWDWSHQIEKGYEWILLLLFVLGLFQFLRLFTKQIPNQFSMLFLMRLIAIAAIVSFLAAMELRGFWEQQAVVEDFARQGGCFFVRDRSILMEGEWYVRLPLAIGLLCSIFGGISSLARVIERFFNQKKL